MVSHTIIKTLLKSLLRFNWIDPQADPEGPPGELEVNFGGFGGPYWVLDTDYESFASVYSCLDGPIGAVKNENAFILTRETFPSDETASCKFYLHSFSIID